MKNILKVAVATAALTLGSALPAMAQFDEGVDFTTAFAFYAGSEKMPAGSYRVTQIDMNSNQLLIQNRDGSDSAFVSFIPTRADQPHAHSDVSFQKYDNVAYLSRVWVAAERYGIKVEPTKAELKAASTTAVAEGTVNGQ